MTRPLTILRDDFALTGLAGRWVRTVPRAGGLSVFVEVDPDWMWLPGWPGWGKAIPKGFTGITDPFKRRVWRRSGTAWSLEGALHERHHPAFQCDRLGRLVFTLHVVRYMLRAWYKGSRIETDANAGRDRALAWWHAHSKPRFIPLAANHWDGVVGSIPIPSPMGVAA